MNSTTSMYYKELLRRYDAKRNKAFSALYARQAQIYKLIPRIKEIDDTLNNYGVQLVKLALKHPNDSDIIARFRKRCDELRDEKKNLLVAANLPSNYLEMHYECEECQDTGFIGDKQCKCFKQALIDLSYEQSNIKTILSKENFSKFTPIYWSKDKFVNANGELTSQYDSMTAIYEHCVSFCKNFKNSHQNLLMLGGTGLGKTFFCNCIAKKILDDGHTVLYFTAPQLFKLLNDSKFNRDSLDEKNLDLISTINKVDLLIIDDLGTEAITTNTISELFDIINSRYVSQLSTIISTNLTFQQLATSYSKRVFSRLYGEYEPLQFIGEDIRKQKKIMALPTK